MFVNSDTPPCVSRGGGHEPIPSRTASRDPLRFFTGLGLWGVLTVTGTAIHEAGHAVVAMRVGLRVKAVSILPREGSTGRCLFDIKRSVDPGARSCASVKLAGQLAEQMARGEKPRVNWLADDPDTADARELLAGERDPLLVRRLVALATAATLFTRWYQVERLAKALERRRVLVGNEVREAALGLVRIDPAQRFVTHGGRRVSLQQWGRLLDEHGNDPDRARKALAKVRP
jgi:hypothetical protein